MLIPLSKKTRSSSIFQEHTMGCFGTRNKEEILLSHAITDYTARSEMIYLLKFIYFQGKSSG